MSYIVQRNNRFYVVAYNGHDPITGRERRRWHPAGSDAGDAEELRRRIDRQRPRPSCAVSLGGFMSTTWLATKGTITRPTANRYRWMIDHNIAPRVGTIRLDALRPDDLDACYGDLIANGGRRRQGPASKSVLEIHRVICNALDLAADRASWRSVLERCSLSNSRTRAASVGGTSTTHSPAATSCWASRAPVPVAPSIAHNRG
jgi:hypothetical protein